MDDVDAANALAEQELESILARRRQLREDARQVASRSACKDCGEPVGPVRMRVLPGVQRCVECARDFERRQGK